MIRVIMKEWIKNETGKRRLFARSNNLVLLQSPFQSKEQIVAAITENWNGLTCENVQRVFHNWMERLIWVIANSGEYYQS
jgi:hypothetical protein